MANWPKRQPCPKCGKQAKRVQKEDGKTLIGAKYKCTCGAEFGEIRMRQ